MGHQQFHSYQSGVGASLELQTNRSNLYGPEYVRPPDLRPEEEKGIWTYFEIRIDEKPSELRDYEPTGKGYELYVAYVWKFE